MKTLRDFYCEACDSAAVLTVESDETPCCPSCHRDSLVLVNKPAGGPVTTDVAERAFAAMRRVAEAAL